jgi:hypothetical protein
VIRFGSLPLNIAGYQVYSHNRGCIRYPGSNIQQIRRSAACRQCYLSSHKTMHVGMYCRDKKPQLLALRTSRVPLFDVLATLVVMMEVGYV